jgi:hypothetical protein
LNRVPSPVRSDVRGAGGSDGTKWLAVEDSGAGDHGTFCHRQDEAGFAPKGKARGCANCREACSLA